MSPTIPYNISNVKNVEKRFSLWPFILLIICDIPLLSCDFFDPRVLGIQINVHIAAIDINTTLIKNTYDVLKFNAIRFPIGALNMDIIKETIAEF